MPHVTSGPVEPSGVAAPSPLRSAARHWISTILLAALGLGLGAAYGYSRPDITTAEARVGVGTGSLAAYQVAGFASASVALASNYARYVGLEQFRPQIEKAVGADAASHVTSVTGSPVPDSNVIRLEVSADKSGVARPVVDVVANSLIAQVKAAAGPETPATVLAQYASLSNQVAAQQAVQERAETAYAKARNAAGASPASSTATPSAAEKAADTAAAAEVAAKTKVATLTIQRDAIRAKYNDLVTAPSSQSQLRSVQRGAVTGTTRRSAVERYGLAGLVAGLVVALALNTARDRRRVSAAAQPAGTTGRRGARAAAGTPDPHTS